MGGLRALSSALTTVLTAPLATALLAFGGIDWVIGFDLFTCAAAVSALTFGGRLPKAGATDRINPC